MVASNPTPMSKHETVRNDSSEHSNSYLQNTSGWLPTPDGISDLLGRITRRVARSRIIHHTRHLGRPPTSTISLDDPHEQLGNWRRRRVLDALADRHERRIGWLSEYIAAIENDCPRKHVDANQRKRVYVGLYQCHLQSLDDAGIVEFNKDRGRVERGPDFWAVRWLQQAGRQISEGAD